jgi:DNA-binding Xre family transcriptional regulator
LTAPLLLWNNISVYDIISQADIIRCGDIFMTDAQKLGRRIYEQRKRLRMTQKELARATELTQGRISQLEHGNSAEIQIERFKALVEQLGVSADWLLELDKNKEMVGVE